MDNLQIKTPNFIKSLFDEDSGLGMEFDHCIDSSSFLQTPEIFHKRKRQTNLETHVSSNKKRCLKSKTKNGLRKALSFDEETLRHNDSKDQASKLLTEDISVEGSVLTGDGSNECCLPTVQGRCHDLRYISSSTMTDVLNGGFDDRIGSFRIIDCRYSYEFDGGHIRGAENIHNKDDILKLFTSPVSDTDDKRHIIIFHCEFSSERGPKMCRYLRNNDRELNAENYPALCYPEIYILKGGYKEFYESNVTLCAPMSYTPMLSKDHKEDLRHFRSKSKSWHAGQKRMNAGSGLFC